MRALRGRRGARGAVAVEFALLLPALLVIIFFTVNAGLVLWTRFGLLGLAHEAVSFCTKQLPITDASGPQSCASSYVTSHLHQYALDARCLGPPMAAANSDPVPIATGNNVYLLSLQLSCNANLVGMPTFSSLNVSWTAPLLSAYGAMPFVIQILGGAPGS